MSEMPGDVNIDMSGIDSAIDRSMRGLDSAMRDLNHGLRGVGVQVHRSGFRRGERLEEHFEVGPDPQLVVESHEGKIEVTAHSASEVVIEAYADSTEETLPIQVEHEGNEVRVAARSGHAHNDVDLRIRVPFGCGARLRTRDGDIDITGVGGPVDIKSVSGDISALDARGACQVVTIGGDVTLGNVEGQVRFSAVDGDLNAYSITGDVEAMTTNGDVQFRSSAIRNLSMESVNGELSVQTSIDPAGRYVLTGKNGDIDLLVPADAALTIHASTRNGEVTFGAPVEITGGSRRNVEATLKGGGALLEATTMQGDVRISPSAVRASDSDDSGRPEVPEPPAPPVAPVSPSAHHETQEEHDRTLEILGDLQRGDLTVEEALKRLEAAG